MTLAELSDWWLANVIEPNPGVRATTAKQYRTALNRLGVAGNHRVVNVTSETLQALQAKLIKGGLAPVTVGAKRPCGSWAKCSVWLSITVS